ncbi:hypothetical protein HYH03_007883 [Edaphochlamys debaryana]|uniref:Uncharacterized protein n=1 Tax=Edaphochlamys debaryana TaxID=47281 RepID=A0A835Y124_9CHLO|nr:hypothetical protein HYH03_007883 [Edaphochlamys debaryana]|eukprot:KAG2493953.1 hypothetical protein HYH03_007883 [Edaphochlamys debaryana]
MEALQGHGKSSASARCPAPVSGWAHSTLPLAMHGSSGHWAKLQPAYADAAGDVAAEGYGSDGSHCAADGSSPASRAERRRNISAAGARADSDTPAAAAADADGASSGGEDHSTAPAKGAAKPASSSSAVALAAETDGGSPDSKRDVSSSASASAAAGALLPEALLELLSRAGGAPGADGAEPTAAFGLAAAKAFVRTVAAALGVGDGGDGDVMALTKILGRLPAAGASVPATAQLELAPLALGTPAEVRAATGSAAAAAAAANVAHPSGSGDADDEGEEASSGWASASRRADRGKEAATAAATAAAASPSLPPPLPASLLTPLPAAAPPATTAAAAAPMDDHAEEAAVVGGCMDEGFGDPDGVDPDRVHCPFPGCTRSFKELWRLKVHYRARPDVRGSGKERGHGMELERCPRCETRLLRGRHHKCALSRAALTAAVTRSSPPPPPAPAPAPPPPTRAAQKAQQARQQQPQPVKVKAEQVPYEAEPYEEPYEEEAPYDPLDMLASAAAMLTGR